MMLFPNPENAAQARLVLQTMCHFILPLIQTVGNSKSQTTIEQLILRVEADEFVSALENLISGMILRTQLASQDIGIEVMLPNDVDTDSLDCVEADDEDSAMSVSRSHNQSAGIKQDQLLLPIYQSPIPKEDPALKIQLDDLRKKVTQHMPIRLLCFDPDGTNSNPKITLLDRSGIYHYLAAKLRKDYREGSHWNSPGYAILSHTWSQVAGELTYDDWNRGSLSAEQPKCQKIVNFCKVSWKDHGLTLGWIDTVCINKESSTELDESIRSMYAWYCEATVCITYLAETKRLSDMPNDPWFTRGWTFQELVAPQCTKFYNMDWKTIVKSEYRGNNDREHYLIQDSIEKATTMKRVELRDIRQMSISRRMELAAKRQLTREEDAAYSLMGIFNVSISTAYGEGLERAFSRLLKEIFNSTKNILDIFNWGGGCVYRGASLTSLFPSRPSNYLTRFSKKDFRPWCPTEPLTLAHLGLRTPILLMPAISSRILVFEHCPIGDYYSTISIWPSREQSNYSSAYIPTIYHLLDKRVTEPAALTSNLQKIWTVGTLNVEAYGTSIRISKACLAVLLAQPKDKGQEVSPTGYRKIYTDSSIVFDLKNTNFSGNNEYRRDDQYGDYYEIERSQLEVHGMRLVTLYL